MSLSPSVGLSSGIDANLLPGFVETLPPLAYAGSPDAYRRVQLLPRDDAIHHPLIQPCFKWHHWVTLDVDRRDDSVLAWETCGRMPNFAVENTDNHHCHYWYKLARPIFWDKEQPTVYPRRPDGSRRTHPTFYLSGVTRWLTTAVGADPSYRGHLAKNPLHARWRLHPFRLTPYLLSELAPVDELTSPTYSVVGTIAQDVGRNVTVFDTVRLWSYAHKHEFGSRSEFYHAIFEQCHLVNDTFPFPLSTAELAGIAKSIARWTWTRYTGTERKSILHLPPSLTPSERKSRGAQYTNERRRELSRSIVTRTREQLGVWATQEQVAHATGLSLSTVKRHW